MTILFLLAFLLLIILTFKRPKSVKLLLFWIIIFYIISVYSKQAADYLNYLIQYDKINLGVQEYEPLYRLLVQIGGKLGLSYDGFKAIITIFQAALIVWIIKHYTDNVALAFMLFLIYPLHIQAFLTRYFIGFVLVLLATHIYLKKKNILAYYILIVMAALCHNSLLFFACLPILMRDNIKKTTLCVLAVFCGFLLISSLNLMNIVGKLFITDEVKYNALFSEMPTLFFVWKSIIKQFLLLAPTFIIICYLYNRYEQSCCCLSLESSCRAPAETSRQFFSRFILQINILSCLVPIFQTYSHGFERLYYFMDFFNCIFFAQLVAHVPRKGQKKHMVYICIAGYCVYKLFRYYVLGSDGARDDLWHTLYGNQIFSLILGSPE